MREMDHRFDPREFENMRNYSSKSEARILDERAEKQRLLEVISSEIGSRGLTYRDLQSIDPKISRDIASRIRRQDISAASIQRLRTIAAGLCLETHLCEAA